MPTISVYISICSTFERVYCRNSAEPWRFALSAVLSPEVPYKLLALLEPNPALSQREISRRLGISLGKVNYCLKALLDKRWIKVASFKNGKNKLAYLYMLTPRGLEAKARLTGVFLNMKLREYETLKEEIEQIRRDARQLTSGARPRS